MGAKLGWRLLPHCRDGAVEAWRVGWAQVTVAVELVLLCSVFWILDCCTSIRRGKERVQPESFAGQPLQRDYVGGQ